MARNKLFWISMPTQTRMSQHQHRRRQQQPHSQAHNDDAHQASARSMTSSLRLVQRLMDQPSGESGPPKHTRRHEPTARAHLSAMMVRLFDLISDPPVS